MQKLAADPEEKNKLTELQMQAAQWQQHGPVAARRRMPLICHGQSNTATISKV